MRCGYCGSRINTHDDWAATLDRNGKAVLVCCACHGDDMHIAEPPIVMGGQGRDDDEVEAYGNAALWFATGSGILMGAFILGLCVRALLGL